MDKLRAIGVFVRIADAGSLTAAAKDLDLSLPVVVRTLAGLESSLSVRLFNRTTRKVTLTDEGRLYLDGCRHVLSTLADADRSVTRDAKVPKGSLTVTAPVLYGTLHVAPAIVSFLARYPEVRVTLRLADRIVNLLEEGIDVGLRIGELQDGSHIAKRVATVRRMVVASPTYLKRHGTPNHPRELVSHECLRFSEQPPTWVFYRDDETLSIPIRGRLELNHVQPLIDACIAGLGCGRFLSYQVDEHIRRGALKVILESYEPPPRPVSITYPHAALLPTRTRAFIDWLTHHLVEGSPPPGSSSRRRADRSPHR